MAPHASSRCSQLSSTSNIVFSPMNRTTVSHGGAARLIGQTQRARDGHRRHNRIGNRRQVHIPDPVTELGREPSREFDGEPRLTGPPGASQGDQTVVSDGPPKLRHFGFPSNETRQLDRKIVRRNDTAHPKRWELIAQIRMTQLHHPLRTRHTPQRVAAQLCQPDTLGQPIRHQRSPSRPTARSGHHAPNRAARASIVGPA